MERPTAALLLLEDSDLDADLVRDRLSACPRPLRVERAADRAGYEVAVAGGRYDLILSDYQVPGFDGLEALELARRHQPGGPFIFVSGVMGEEVAVEAVRRGATDYLVKQRLARLVPAVERALAESAERAGRTRAEHQLKSALAAGRMGTWTLDLRTGRLDASDTCKANYGRGPGDRFTYDDLAAAVHDEDRPRWRAAVDAAAAAGADLDIEYRTRWPDGSVHWVMVRASCDGRAGVMSGVSADVTARRRAEDERERLLSELARREEELRLVTDAVPALIAYLDRDGVYQFANRQYEAWMGLTPDRVVGRHLREVVGEVAYQTVRKSMARALAGERVEFEAFVEYPSGGRHVRVCYVPRYDGARVTGFFALITDVSAIRRAEQTARFAAAVSAALAELTDSVSTMQKVAGLSVPTFADWCAVDMMDDAGRLRRVAVTHAEPTKLRAYRELVEKYPPRDGDPHGVRHVLRTGRPDLVEHVTDDLLAAIAHDGEHLRGLRALGLRSHLLVPICAQGRAFGVLTFLTAESGRHYTAGDLGVAQDIAHRAAVAIQNADLYLALREADRRKDEFLATLAHELRNPLAPIRTGLALLRLADGDRLAAEQVRARMERQTAQLVRLVDDLMDVSRISRGRLELKKERTDLAAVVGNAVDASRPLIEEMGHALTVDLPAEPVVLDADPTRLAQVFMNLLTNAAKYSDRGGRIRLTAVPRAGEVEVVVMDGGIGIPADKLNSIFELFSQVDQSLEKAQGGLGIGLSLVRRLVELHGGTVHARSDGPGKGSEFVVRLPLAVAGPGARDGGPAGSRPRSAHRILIVDDNRDGADTLSEMLRLSGNETRTAYDGAAGVAAAAQFRPQVVLLDIGLPKLNGHDACRRIRSAPWGANAVLIALTGWGQEEDVRKSREAGFDHHLVKPVDPQALMTLLSQI